MNCPNFQVFFLRVELIKSSFFTLQVQEFLSSLVEEEQEEMKKELIFIKNIFIKLEEEQDGGAVEEKDGEIQTEDKGDLSPHLHCSTSM